MSFENAEAIVVYAPMKEADLSVPLYPEERFNEILRCKNDKTKQEKYQVWQLLELAVKKYLNFDFANLQFTKTANGQWVCPDFYFSLSHTDGLVCVALAREPIGVDAELVRSINEGLSTRILTPSELSHGNTLSSERRGEYLLECWVKKESIFKRSGTAALMPGSIETSEHPTSIKSVTVGAREYLISVCHGSAHKTEFKHMEDI